MVKSSNIVVPTFQLKPFVGSAHGHILVVRAQPIVWVTNYNELAVQELFIYIWRLILNRGWQSLMETSRCCASTTTYTSTSLLPLTPICTHVRSVRISITSWSLQSIPKRNEDLNLAFWVAKVFKILLREMVRVCGGAILGERVWFQDSCIKQKVSFVS